MAGSMTFHSQHRRQRNAAGDCLFEKSGVTLPQNVSTKQTVRNALAQPLIHFDTNLLLDAGALLLVRRCQFGRLCLAQLVLQAPSLGLMRVSWWHDRVHERRLRQLVGLSQPIVV
jgi:hypothetical protein